MTRRARVLAGVAGSYVALGALVGLVPLLGFTYGELGRSMAAITFACAVASALGGRAGLDLWHRAARALAR